MNLLTRVDYAKHWIGYRIHNCERCFWTETFRLTDARCFLIRDTYDLISIFFAKTVVLMNLISCGSRLRVCRLPTVLQELI
jgi:hypothetical protein